MIGYKLLTPGPLTTTESVKKAMMTDHCTWDDDYKKITQEIRKEILDVVSADPEEYTAVLMQGSGTFGVESVITSSVGSDDRLLICANGAYGMRMKEIAEYAGIDYILYEEPYSISPDSEKVRKILEEDPSVTHVAMVHCETTSGILNDIEAVGNAVNDAGRKFIVDAMSSLGGVPVDIRKVHADFMISSSNKCVQGVPGFSFIIARKTSLEECRGKARSLSLDLYSQYETMENDGGKWRFTSPTHVVLAFRQALKELAEETVEGRFRRYSENSRVLREKLAEAGIRTYISEEKQSPVIATFMIPETEGFDFMEMYSYIKERGYAIYPGKVTDADTFRIGSIGDVYSDDMMKVAEIIKNYLEEKNGSN